MTLFVQFVLLTILVNYSYGSVYDIDMDKNGVCVAEPTYTLGDLDVAHVYAQPLQSSSGTMARCTVKINGNDGRLLKFHLREIQFTECQVFVRVYDNNAAMNNPRWSFDCNSGGGYLYRSWSSNLIFSLQKPSAASHGYKFYLTVATENGPDIGGEETEGDVEEKLPIGVQVGIGVGVTIFVLLIAGLVAYFVIVWKRKKEEKELALSISKSSLFGPSTAYSVSRGASSVHSSVHPTAASDSSGKENPIFNYPAYRTSSTIKPKGDRELEKYSDSEKIDGHVPVPNQEDYYKSKSKSNHGYSNNSVSARGKDRYSSRGRHIDERRDRDEGDGDDRRRTRSEDRRDRDHSRDRERDRDRDRERDRDRDRNRRHESTRSERSDRQRHGEGDRYNSVRSTGKRSGHDEYHRKDGKSERPVLNAENIRNNLRREREERERGRYSERTENDRPRARSSSAGARSRNTVGRSHSPQPRSTASASTRGTGTVFTDRHRYEDERSDRDHRRPQRSSSTRSESKKRSQSHHDDRRHQSSRYDDDFDRYGSDRYYSDYDDRKHGRHGSVGRSGGRSSQQQRTRSRSPSSGHRHR